MWSIRATSLVSRQLRQSLLTNAIRSTTSRSLSTAKTPPSPNPSSPPTNYSAFFRRFLYLTTGAAAVGLGIAYASNPDPVNKATQELYSDLESQIRLYTEPSREKLLPDQVSPYPGAPPVRTLVIDLDNTLVFSSYSRASGWRVAKRPGAEAFLAYMAQFYEIVVFTGNLYNYADPILDKMDPNVFVSHRLYRGETHYKHGVHIKDLSHLNRALERVIVIDHDEKQVSMQPENAIVIPEWTGDPNDTALLDLIPFLESLVRTDVSDVRDAVGVFKGKTIVEGVSQWRQVSAERESAGRQASLFGHGVPPASVQGREEEDGASKGVVWGTLSGTGLFGGGGQAQRSGE